MKVERVTKPLVSSPLILLNVSFLAPVINSTYRINIVSVDWFQVPDALKREGLSVEHAVRRMYSPSPSPSH